MLKQTNLVKPNLHGAHQKGPRSAPCEPRPAAGKELELTHPWPGTGLPPTPHHHSLALAGGRGGHSSRAGPALALSLSPSIQRPRQAVGSESQRGPQGPPSLEESQASLSKMAKFLKHFLSKPMGT